VGENSSFKKSTASYLRKRFRVKDKGHTELLVLLKDKPCRAICNSLKRKGKRRKREPEPGRTAEKETVLSARTLLRTLVDRRESERVDFIRKRQNHEKATRQVQAAHKGERK